MFIKDIDFNVEFTLFAERHFCKDFSKKYSREQWVHTRNTIVSTLERAHALQSTDKIDLISFLPNEGVGVFKLDFAVAGTNTSPKSSGNRVVFGLCNNTGTIEVLMVYGKNHCPKNMSETQWFLGEVKKNFPKYKNIC